MPATANPHGQGPLLLNSLARKGAFAVLDGVEAGPYHDFGFYSGFYLDS